MYSVKNQFWNLELCPNNCWSSLDISLHITPTIRRPLVHWCVLCAKNRKIIDQTVKVVYCLFKKAYRVVNFFFQCMQYMLLIQLDMLNSSDCAGKFIWSVWTKNLIRWRNQNGININTKCGIGNTVFTISVEFFLHILILF